ncbi:hypothetical protein M440DRAFT_1107771 [Trichoderma longibrachiatum ATCC 18648]|uniref:Uncharacterized protein n=1 Tax=Trichoderma longibrachiatum ATCC 18648 TaxID=983965 RepID=A0A2T4CEK6_TRILO|nr:hypothetical protein M440DRAFT_1107771 [Trichoderma longibrachiatum ATCC 18648]
MTEYRSLYCTAQFPVQLTWPYTPQSLRFLYMLRHTHSRCCEKQAMSASSRISYNVLLLQYSVHTGRPILCPSPVSQCGSTAAATYCGPAMTFKQKALTITVLAWMSGRTRKIPRASSVSTCDGGCSFHVHSSSSLPLALPPCRLAMRKVEDSTARTPYLVGEDVSQAHHLVAR